MLQGEAQTDYAKMLLLTVPPALIVSGAEGAAGLGRPRCHAGCTLVPSVAVRCCQVITHWVSRACRHWRRLACWRIVRFACRSLSWRLPLWRNSSVRSLMPTPLLLRHLVFRTLSDVVASLLLRRSAARSSALTLLRARR